MEWISGRGEVLSTFSVLISGEKEKQQERWQSKVKGRVSSSNKCLACFIGSVRATIGFDGRQLIYWN